MQITSCKLHMIKSEQLHTFKFSIRKIRPEIVGHLILNEAALKLASQQTTLASDQLVTVLLPTLYHQLELLF